MKLKIRVEKLDDWLDRVKALPGYHHVNYKDNVATAVTEQGQVLDVYIAQHIPVLQGKKVAVPAVNPHNTKPGLPDGSNVNIMAETNPGSRFEVR